MSKHPFLRSVAMVTVTAFTITTLLPAGWAWAAPARDTMRVRQAEPDGAPSPVAAGLEEALRRQPAPPLTEQEIAARTQFAEEQHAAATASRSGRSFWRRVVPPMQRVTATWAIALQLVGARPLTVHAQGAATPPVALTPIPAAAAPAVSPTTAVTMPPPLSFGYVPTPNTIIMDYPTGRILESAPNYFFAPQGLQHPLPFSQALTDELWNAIRQGSAAVSDRLGLTTAVPTAQQVLTTNWTPAVFAPTNAAVASFPIWSPLAVEQTSTNWWPPLLTGVAKAAVTSAPGVRPRVYLGSYEMLSPTRLFAPDAMLRIINEAAARGVEEVPILGDPTWAIYPDAARFVLRALARTTMLMRDTNGVVHVAIDIEPEELPGFEQMKAWTWANILRVVKETQEFLNTLFQSAGDQQFRGVEITLFVSPYVASFIHAHNQTAPPARRLIVPRGTRLMVMAYTNRVDEAARYVTNTVNIVAADTNSFPNVTVGAAVEVGPVREPGKTFFGPDAATNAWRAGVLIQQQVGANPVFNGEYFTHTPEWWDLVLWLKQRGYTTDQLADRQLWDSWRRSGLPSLRMAAAFLTGRELFPRRATFGEPLNGRPMDDKAAEESLRFVQRLFSGGVGWRAAESSVGMAWETALRSARRGGLDPRVDFDAWVAGPDVGPLAMLGRYWHNRQFGRTGRIERVTRTIVDPVSGRVIVPEHDILVDGRHLADDADIVQLPGNRYDILWTVTVANRDPAATFTAWLRLMPNTGSGEPVEGGSPAITLLPGQSTVITLRSHAGVDDYRQEDPDWRGRYQQHATVYEGLYLINPRGPEIADAVGVAAYDSLELAKALHDEQNRLELLTHLQPLVEAGQVTALSVEGLHRPLGLHVTCRLMDDRQPGEDPVALVQTAATNAVRIGAEYLVVKLPDIWKMIPQEESVRRRVAHPAVAQLQQLLAAARVHGLKVAWWVNPETAEIWEPSKSGAGDRVRRLFRNLKTLLEDRELGLNRAHLLIMSPAGMKADDRAWVVTLYQNAQQPLLLAGPGSEPVPVGSLKIPRAWDLTTTADPVAALRQERSRAPDASRGLALVTAAQAAALPTLAAATAADSLANELVGPLQPLRPGEEARRSEGGVVTPTWLTGQLGEPRRYVRPVATAVLDTLRLRTLVPFTTGHPSVEAQLVAPENTREFNLRFLMFDDGRALMKSVQLPVLANQYDLTKTLTVWVTNVPKGVQGVNVEIVPRSEARTFPSEPQRTMRPGVTVPAPQPGQTSFWALNPGVTNEVSLGRQSLYLSEAPVGWMTGVATNGAPVRWWTTERYRLALRADGGPILEFGHDLAQGQLWYRVGNGSVGWVARPVSLQQRGPDDGVRALAVGEWSVRIGWEAGRIRLAVAATAEEAREQWRSGQVAQLWSIDDLQAAARWEKEVNVREDGTTVAVTIEPRARQMDAVSVPAITLPPPVTTLSTNVVDTTRDTVVPYSRFSEWTARTLFWGVVLVFGVGGVYRALRRDYRKDRTTLRASVTSAAPPSAPAGAPLSLTTPRQAPPRVGAAAQIIVTTAAAIGVLGAVCGGLGAIPLWVSTLLVVSLGRGLMRFLWPEGAEWVRQLPKIGTLVETIGRAGTLLRVSVLWGAGGYLAKVAAWPAVKFVWALTPFAWLAAHGVSAGTLGVAAAIGGVAWLGFRVWQSTRQAGLEESMQRVAPMALKVGAIAGLAYFGFLAVPQVTIGSLFTAYGLYHIARWVGGWVWGQYAPWLLGYLSIGLGLERIRAVFKNKPLAENPKFFQPWIKRLTEPKVTETGWYRGTEVVYKALVELLNRTPFSAATGFGGAWLLHVAVTWWPQWPWLASPTIATVIGVGTALWAGFLVGQGLWMRARQWWEQSRERGRDRPRVAEPLAVWAEEDLVTLGRALPDDPEVARHRQELVEQVYLPAIRAAIPDPARQQQVLDAARRATGLPPAAGLEEVHLSPDEERAIRGQIVLRVATQLGQQFMVSQGQTLDTLIQTARDTVKQRDDPAKSASAALRAIEDGLPPAAAGSREVVERAIRDFGRAVERADRAKMLGEMGRALQRAARSVEVAEDEADKHGLDALAEGAKVARETLEHTAGRITAPDQLLNGYALVIQQSPEVILFLDVGAQFGSADKPDSPWYAQPLARQIHLLKRDLWKTAMNPNIMVFPELDLRYTVIGPQALGTPLVFLSQGVQYPGASAVRVGRSKLSDAEVIRHALAFVRSDMEYRFYDFINGGVVSRWLRGHEHYLWEAFHGRLFSWESRSLTPVRMSQIRGGLMGIWQLLGRRDEATARAVRWMMAFPQSRSLLYLGHQPGPAQVRVRDWDDLDDMEKDWRGDEENEKGIRDPHVFGNYGSGGPFDPGVTVVHLTGAKFHEVVLFTSYGLEIPVGDGGAIQVGRHPAKFSAAIEGSAERHGGYPKSERASLGASMANGFYTVQPILQANGAVDLAGVTPWADAGTAADMAKAQELLAAARAAVAPVANAMAREATEWVRTDGSRVPPSLLKGGLEERYPLAGPRRMGWSPERHLRELAYQVADVLTLKRWGEGWTPQRWDAQQKQWVPAPELFGDPNRRFDQAEYWLKKRFLDFAHIGYPLAFWPAVLFAGLLWGVVSVPVWICSLFLSWIGQDALFRQQTPVSFWNLWFRQDSIISSYRYDFNADRLIELTRRATVGRRWPTPLLDGTGLTTVGRPMSPLPPDVSEDEAKGYAEFLNEGLNALEGTLHDKLLLTWMIEMGRGLSPQRWRENPNLPAESWERHFARLIRRDFSKIPDTKRVAAQYAIFHTLQYLRLAIGHDEKLIRALYYGSHDIGVPHVGNVNKNFMRTHEELHDRLHELINAMMPGVTGSELKAFKGEMAPKLRAWIMGAPTFPMTISSVPTGGGLWTDPGVYGGRGPVQAYINAVLAGKTKSFTRWALDQSPLQFDTDELVDLQADWWQALSNAAGMEESAPPGVPRFKWWQVSAELRHSGILRIGRRPDRPIIVDGLLYHVAHWWDHWGRPGSFLNALGRFLDRVAGVGGSLGLGWVASKLAVAAGPSVAKALATVAAAPAAGLILGRTMAVVIGIMAVSAALDAVFSRGSVKNPSHLINRLASVAGSLGLGWLGGQIALAAGPWVAKILATATAAAAPVAGPVLGGAMGTVIGVVAIGAAISALFSRDGLRGKRLDMRKESGALSYGDGVRALSLLPGFVQALGFKALWFAYKKAEDFGVDRWVGMLIPEARARRWMFSRDAHKIAKAMGQDVTMFRGFVHDIEHPKVAGSAPPSLMMLGATFGTASGTAVQAGLVPAPVALRLAAEWEDSRELSTLNYLAADWLRGTLGDDTFHGWLMKRLGDAGSPATPAVGIETDAMIRNRILQMLAQQHPLLNALQFRKGMGMESGAYRLRGGRAVPTDVEETLREVKALPPGERLAFFLGVADVLQAAQVNEVSGPGRHGLGVFDYLFFNKTLHPLVLKSLGAYAPGEVEAHLKFLLIAYLDDELYGGAIARQLEQMNIEQKTLSGPPTIRADQTLLDESVRQRLRQGTFIDPTLAIVAVWMNRDRGLLLDRPVPGLTGVRDIRDVLVTTLGAPTLIPPHPGAEIVEQISDVLPQLRGVNATLERLGKTTVIVASSEFDQRIRLLRPPDPFAIEVDDAAPSAAMTDPTGIVIESSAGVEEAPVTRPAARAVESTTVTAALPSENGQSSAGAVPVSRVLPVELPSEEPAWMPGVRQAAAPAVAVTPQAEAQMGLDVMAAGLKLTEPDTVTVAAVPASVVIQADPALAPLAGRIIKFGDARLALVPDDPAAASGLVVSLMSEPAATVVIRTYGGLEEAALNAFDARARQVGFQVQPRQPLPGTALGDILRQILANLSGLEEAAITERDLRELVEALTLRALA